MHRRLSWRIFQLSLGVVCVQSVFGAVALLGWTQRWMRRAGIKEWARKSRFSTWDQATHEIHELSEFRDWPSFFLEDRTQRARMPIGSVSKIRWGARLGFASLLRNLKSGLQTLFNTCVLTLPGCLLMQFSWYDGWNNSFNKGYEQALVGPFLGWLGILFFITAMFYVPMAQARQSLCDDWRRFYDFRLVWKLIRRDWLSSACLAGGYALLALPMTVLKVLPEFLPQISPHLASYSEAQASSLLNRYFLAAGLVFLPAFLILRLAAARGYARAILKATQSGAIPESDLGGAEWKAMNHLGLLREVASPMHPRWRRMALWLGTRTGQVVAAGVIFLCWTTFVLQLYVGEFLIHHPYTGFAHQPLIQLPLFSNLP